MNYIKLLRKKKQEEERQQNISSSDLIIDNNSTGTGNNDNIVSVVALQDGNQHTPCAAVVTSQADMNDPSRAAVSVDSICDSKSDYHSGEFNCGICTCELITLDPTFSTMKYCTSFLGVLTQQHLLGKITANENGKYWKYLRSRRLQCGVPAPGQDSDISGLQFPCWLQEVVNNVVDQNVFPPGVKPNQVLINDYSENEGIMHHCDGDAYHDTVAIISLGSPRLLTFRPKLRTDEIGIKNGSDVVSVVLEPGSLFVFAGYMFTHMLHGIVSHTDLHEVGCGCLQKIEEAEVPCVNYSYTMLTEEFRNTIVWKPRTSLTIRSVKV